MAIKSPRSYQKSIKKDGQQNPKKGRLMPEDQRMSSEPLMKMVMLFFSFFFYFILSANSKSI
jgi:hypothetical protein